MTSVTQETDMLISNSLSSTRANPNGLVRGEWYGVGRGTCTYRLPVEWEEVWEPPPTPRKNGTFHLKWRVLVQSRLVCFLCHGACADILLTVSGERSLYSP